MENQNVTSCWRVAAWSLLGVATVLALIYLLGGFEPGLVPER